MLYEVFSRQNKVLHCLQAPFAWAKIESGRPYGSSGRSVAGIGSITSWSPRRMAFHHGPYGLFLAVLDRNLIDFTDASFSVDVHPSLAHFCYVLDLTQTPELVLKEVVLPEIALILKGDEAAEAFESLEQMRKSASALVDEVEKRIQAGVRSFQW